MVQKLGLDKKNNGNPNLGLFQRIWKFSGIFQLMVKKLDFLLYGKTNGIKTIDAPVRHGEGKFIAAPSFLKKMLTNNIIALKYLDNPNGSVENIAGITDLSGQILGMMPHPEAFLIKENHPLWYRNSCPAELGLAIFKNGVEYAENL